MSKKIKDEQKKFLGETLNQYDKALDEAINQLDKKNREQNHKISSLTNSFDNEYLEKDVEGNMTALENSKNGMVIINEIQGSTEVNYCKDGEKELILNGDIDTQGESFVTITEGVDGGLVDVSLEGNTEINLSKTKDPVLVTREFDDINCNVGKLQYTIDDVTTINDEPGKVDIDRIVGDTMVNHAVNGSEELILNAHINESGDNNITLNGVTSEGGLVDVALEGNTMVNVCDQKDPIAITKSYTVETGNHVALQGEYDGKCRPVVTGNTLVNLISNFANSISPQGTYTATNKGFTLEKQHDGGISYFRYKLKYPLDTSKKYTIIYDIVENTLVNTDSNFGIYTDGVYGAMGSTSTTGGSVDGKLGKMVSVHSIKSSTNYQDTLEYLSIGIHQGDAGGKLVIDNLMLLEGNHTNKPTPDYFTGMQSSFEDKVVTQEMVDNGEELAENLGKYKVEYKVTGKNKIDTAKYFDCAFGSKAICVKAKANTTYTYSSTYEGVVCFALYKQFSTLVPNDDKNKSNVIFSKGDATSGFSYTTPNYDCYIWINLSGSNDNQLEEGSTATAYEPYKEYKKTFYLNSPLLEGDTIEQQGNNVVHVHRYKEVVSDGSDDEKWAINGDGINSHKYFIRTELPSASSLNCPLLCDKLPTVTFGDLDNGLKYGVAQAYGIRINISEVDANNGATVDEFRTWLQSNPVTVVYQLASPQYEVISQNDTILCDSYINGHLDVDSVVPIKKVVFKDKAFILKYLYPSTKYTVQFESDGVGEVYTYMAGVSPGNKNIVKGINKFNLTTNSTISYLFIGFSGIGFNMSNIVVTEAIDQDFGYFEGMKSVGECEGNKIEILSRNKNLIDTDISNWTSGKCIDVKTGEIIISANRALYDKYIPVTPGSKLMYTGYIDNKGNLNTNGICILQYDFNKKYLGYSWGGNNSTLSAKCRYIKIWVDTVAPWNQLEKICSQAQLEEGNISTDRVPHASTTQTLTHEPLRAVGGVKDKYVLIDGKWYIERRCGGYTFTGNENWKTDASSENIQAFITDSVPNVRLSTTNILSNIYPMKKIRWSTNELGFDTGSGSNFLMIYVLKSDASTIEELRSYLSNNEVSITYELATPQYEKIDYNPLEVYSDTTHIFTNSTIPTNITVKNHGYNLVALKENTQYTLYVNKDTTNALTYRLGDYVEINSQSKFTFTTPSTLTDKTLRIDGKGAKVNDLMLIEGTPTNDSIGYFDGLKSSYECEQVTDEADENYGKYKVDIKVVGKNLFDMSKVILNKYQNSNIGTGNFGIINNPGYKISEFIPVKPNTTYTKSSKIGVFYDENKNPITHTRIESSKIFTTPYNCRYVVFTFAINDDISNWQLEEGDTATEYEPYFESKQTIYLNSPLLKGDEIVWKDNKIQHYHKMGIGVLNGSEDWRFFNNTIVEKINTLDFYIPNYHGVHNSIVISDKFKTNNYGTTYMEDKEAISGCGGSGLNIWLSINKSRINPQNTNGLKEWLSNNPIKLVYTLETPYYEEISDYPLKLNVIANSSLSTESTIQVTNISFNIYEETLPYLYPNTKYYITFNSDVDRKNIIIDLGGNHTVLDCKVGFNKVEITTPSDTTNLLTFSGTGVNIDHVKVTQQDIDEYFEGMKSVGECEELEITSANSDNTLLNTQQLTHEPLRAVGEVKDRYVLIDNKWYIERRCGEIALESLQWEYNNTITNSGNTFAYTGGITNILVQSQVTKNYFLCNIVEATKVHNHEVDKEQITQFIHSSGIALRISRDKLQDNSVNSLNEFLLNNNAKLVYQLKTPVYEPIDYNPFEVYSDVTHITTNSLIPTNVVVKNHGYNCILKPSTKYTVALNKPNGTISAKLGGSTKVDSTSNIFIITTPSTLNDNVLRLSGSGNVKDIMILEGDKTTNTPSYFEGIESGFEQEYDEEKGKYRVNIRVQNEDATKENYIEFYINEPLRGIRDIKDRVYVKDDKVVVERNCGSVTFDGSDDEDWNSRGSGRFLSTSLVTRFNNLEKCDKFITGEVLWNKDKTGIYIESSGGFCICFSSKNNKYYYNISEFKQWLSENPTTVVYQLAEPTYEEVDCDLSKLVLENYENSSLIFESNIPVSANIKYSGEVPVVTQAKALSSKVDNTTLDINENIIPYMCDIDYRIVELQLMNGDTQGEGIELLGIGDIEILGNENVLFNNREDKKHNFSYDMLKRDILSQRYSREEYQYRLDRYLLANKISNEEYKELEGLLNNGE